MRTLPNLISEPTRPLDIFNVAVNLILLLYTLYLLLHKDISRLKHVGKSGWFSFVLYIWAGFFSILFLQPNKTYNLITLILTGVVATIWFGFFYIWLRFDYLNDSPKAKKLVASYSFSVLYNAYYWARINLAAQSMLFYTYGAIFGFGLGQILSLIFAKNKKEEEIYTFLGFGIIYPIWAIVGVVGKEIVVSVLFNL